MIYFDSAATTLMRPVSVKKAVLDAMELGNAGRGGHFLALKAAERLYAAREKIASHFGAEKPENVMFFYNATHALNTVIKMCVGRGERVLISDMEHNAVRRPALSLEKTGGAVDVFPAFAPKAQVLRDFESRITPKTAAAVFVHTSNVCPYTLPVKELCGICRKHGILSVIDCAQAAGHTELSMRQIGSDGMVIPSHKGLMGIAGAGILLADDRLAAVLENRPTLLEGGSGQASFEREMPAVLPERLEAGTVALPAILSAAAGVSFLEKIGYDAIEKKMLHLQKRTAEGLLSLPGVALWGGTSGIGPLTFTLKNGKTAELAGELYRQGICVREGFHCAPLAHTTIGTGQTGGIRISFSPFNQDREVDRFLSIVNCCMKNI